MTGSRIIAGLTPCNLIPEEILTDHEDRFRAMFVDAANPIHSLADSPKMREAFEALDFVVVVDVAMTETARLADYVLPVATAVREGGGHVLQLRVSEQLLSSASQADRSTRRALLGSRTPNPTRRSAGRAVVVDGRGARERLGRGPRSVSRENFSSCLPASRASSDSRPSPSIGRLARSCRMGRLRGRPVWALAQIAAQRVPASIRRAGIGEGVDEAALGDALLDAILAGDRGVVFAVDDWAESLGKIETETGRIQMALPELFEELDSLATEERPEATNDFPFALSAGERRSFTANTIVRDPAWRKKDAEGALRICAEDAAALSLEDGGQARLTTRRGSAVVRIEISDRMQPGHISLPNGTGLTHPRATGIGGISPNELTSIGDRDPIAGTPWHKLTAARLEAV